MKKWVSRPSIQNSNVEWVDKNVVTLNVINTSNQWFKCGLRAYDPNPSHADDWH